MDIFRIPRRECVHKKCDIPGTLIGSDKLPTPTDTAAYAIFALSFEISKISISFSSLIILYFPLSKIGF